MVKEAFRLIHKRANPRSSYTDRQQSAGAIGSCNCNFNPRSPCGERLMMLTPPIWFIEFQSTLLMRGATTKLCFHSMRLTLI